MQTVRGILIGSVLLFAGAAQALQLNVHTPTIHQLNPQPLPPGAAIVRPTGKSPLAPADAASPKLYNLHNGTHIQFDKHKDW